MLFVKNDSFPILKQDNYVLPRIIDASRQHVRRSNVHSPGTKRIVYSMTSSRKMALLRVVGVQSPHINDNKNEILHTLS
jgi:hypothetical protein